MAGLVVAFWGSMEGLRATLLPHQRSGDKRRSFNEGSVGVAGDLNEKLCCYCNHPGQETRD